MKDVFTLIARPDLHIQKAVWKDRLLLCAIVFGPTAVLFAASIVQPGAQVLFAGLALLWMVMLGVMDKTGWFSDFRLVRPLPLTANQCLKMQDLMDRHEAVRQFVGEINALNRRVNSQDLAMAEEWSRRVSPASKREQDACGCINGLIV